MASFFSTKISMPHIGVASCLWHCTSACSLSIYGKDTIRASQAFCNTQIYFSAKAEMNRSSHQTISTADTFIFPHLVQQPWVSLLLVNVIFMVVHFRPLHQAVLTNRKITAKNTEFSLLYQQAIKSLRSICNPKFSD